MHRRSVEWNHGAIRRAIAGVWTTAAILGGLACSEGPMGPEPEDLALDEEAPPRVVPPEVDAFAHHADVTDVTVGWAAVPQGIERAASLTLVAQSHADEPRRVTPRVLVRGLDDRTAELELGTLELAPHDRAELTVRLDALPVQGISHSVTLLASGTYDAAGEAITVQSEPLAFHFEAGYAAAFVYTLDTMVSELDGGTLVDDPRELEGRVLDRGTWVAVAGDLGSDAIPDGLGSIEYTYEITTPEERAHGISPSLVAPTDPAAAGSSTSVGDSPDPNIPPAWCAMMPWDCCTGDDCVDVCVDWTTTYVDASAANAATKEDYAVGGATQTVDASYAQFDITKFTCGPYICWTSTVKSDLLLGPDGCATLDLPAGSGYSFKAKTRLQHGAGGNTYPVEHHTANDPNTNVGVVTISSSFTVPVPGSPLPPPMITLPQHQAANAAAAVSRTLASGAAVDQPSGFTILSGLGCGSQPGIPATDACAGSQVKTGPYTNPDNSAGDLRWKFILAHEIGHVMQQKAMGTLWNPYCFTPAPVDVTTNCNAPNTADHPNVDESCRCDHVSGSNGLHCLQSFEYTPVAQLEGYAQFFSARVWNAADSTCLFRYYKQFLNDGAVNPVQPPFNASCSTMVNWRDNHCFHAQAGTEYDWMQFLWNLHAVGNNKLSIHEIYEVYRGACSDENCSGEAPEWPALEASAAAYFGAGSAKHTKFVTTADAAGVDTTEF